MSPSHASRDFDSFCLAQYDGLVAAVALVCGDRATAEELAQTALERAWGRWDVVSRMDSPGGWTRQVAFNLARSGLRRRMAERRANRRHGPTIPVDPVDTAAILSVRAALAALPDRQREALVHRYYGQASTAETARAMGTTEGAVKQLVLRGTAAMRHALADHIAAPAEVDNG